MHSNSNDDDDDDNIAQNNLRTGRVATPGTPTQPPRTIFQPYLPGGGNVHAPI